MESDFIRWLRKQTPPSNLAPLGLSDDAALLQLDAGGKCVVTSDMLADGVHFELDRCGPQRAGRKALAVNLSDLAAMAARPRAAFVSVLAPRGRIELLQHVYEGLLPLADEFGVALAGGDTNSWDGPLVISVTLLGELTGETVWTRSGAQAGDEILVTGDFGGSMRGKHLDFTPRVREALQLAQDYDIHAATDVSDGLSLDLAHVAAESNCGAELQLDAIPIAEAARLLSAHDGHSPLEHAIGDGEDFELILAVAANEATRLLAAQPLSTPLSRIGRFCAEPGLWTQTSDGLRTPLQPVGFEHA